MHRRPFTLRYGMLALLALASLCFGIAGPLHHAEYWAPHGHAWGHGSGATAFASGARVAHHAHDAAMPDDGACVFCQLSGTAVPAAPVCLALPAAAMDISDPARLPVCADALWAAAAPRGPPTTLLSL